MGTPWTYQKDEVTGKFFVTSNKTPPFGADVCYGIKEEANARLIASAPELLEALKEIAELFAGDPKNGNPYLEKGAKAFRFAEEAISKAEGRA